MDRSDLRIAEISFDTAVFAVANWREGRSAADAEVIHHVLSMMGDVGISLSDPLLDGIEADVNVSRDSDSAFGLYTLGLAKVGPLAEHRITEAFERLRLSRTDLAMRILNTPFSRDQLERLMLSEALLLHKDMLGAVLLDELKLRLSALKQDIFERDGFREQSYPAYLNALAGVLTNEHREAEKVFSNLLKQVENEAEPLWYGDSLPNNCFVVLNACRSKHLIGSDLAKDVLATSIKRLRTVARERLHFLKLRPTEPILPVVALIDLLPYVRFLLETDDGPHLREKLRERTETAHDRILVALHLMTTEEEDKKKSLSEAVREVVASSLVMDSQLDRLSGGLSGSEVFIASITVKRPFIVAGQTVVFKVAEGATYGREVRNLEVLTRLGLRSTFAGILSEPTTVKVGEQYPSILLYEHLAGYVTLRHVLQNEAPGSLKLQVLSEVCSRLAETLYSRCWAQNEDPSDLWIPAVERLVQLSGQLSFVKTIPLFRSRIATLHRQTMAVLEKLPELSLIDRQPSFMHGDLNCRNIMLRISGADVLEVRLIDYETLDVRGDCLMDVGELIEDAILCCSTRYAEAIERTINEGLLRRALWLKQENAFRERLWVARLRSLLFLVRNLLLTETSEAERPANRAINRWEKLLTLAPPVG
jgi:hypothetical protein